MLTRSDRHCFFSQQQEHRRHVLMETKVKSAFISPDAKKILLTFENDVYFQWIPSHVDIHGNDLVDNLAKESSSHPIPSSSEITFLELFSRKKAQNEAERLVLPSHHWHKGRKPGRIFTNPTLIELRQEIGQYDWLTSPRANEVVLCFRTEIITRQAIV
ncbi:hypothetical protein AVEN_113929-1 [Araneus ventricosus]|uniref:Uncharacterized protein n=1 Tax=Araneus ventricosus TaxID=182803 RepID=A0A4Y2S7C1_ARAVE|nr:hypothetical protein AVEN_144558-1 [Araneus ventricosus]GBN84114.1 hypothetical protein AVEN_113929-1 [Araneus ventricosus]